MRPLSAEEEALVQRVREVAHTLYDGVRTPHRSCGIAMAETFGRPTPAYQALRRGGITGCGECGVLVGARLVLGELLGDPDPTGQVTPVLREAMEELERGWPSRLNRGKAQGDSMVCNTLTAPFDDFRSPERHAFCTRLAADMAQLVAEILVRRGVPVDPPQVP
jgi:hypothetical protein